jgi:hypothetical protein
VFSYPTRHWLWRARGGIRFAAVRAVTVVVVSATTRATYAERQWGARRDLRRDRGRTEIFAAAVDRSVVQPKPTHLVFGPRVLLGALATRIGRAAQSRVRSKSFTLHKFPKRLIPARARVR